MSKLSITEGCRRVVSSALSIAVATCMVLGLSAGTASADPPTKLTVCYKGKVKSVPIHRVPDLLEKGARLGACEGEVCACSSEFFPVTCANGVTYANECFAECAGQSGCERLAICSNIWNPVTCDGVTYANACQAFAAGATNCGTLCACPQDYAPVTCADGKIYINACVAECNQQGGCTPL